MKLIASIPADKFRMVVVGDRGAYVFEWPAGLYSFSLSNDKQSDGIFKTREEAEAAARTALSNPDCPMWIDASPTKETK